MIFDNLPHDIIHKCYTYIKYPQPNCLLKDIKDTYIINKLTKYNETKLYNIYYELLKIWHIKYASCMINELEMKFEAIKLYVGVFGFEKDCNILWVDEIFKLIGIDSPYESSFIILKETKKIIPRELVLEII